MTTISLRGAEEAARTQSLVVVVNVTKAKCLFGAGRKTKSLVLLKLAINTA
jgi:hypothetical protein